MTAIDPKTEQRIEDTLHGTSFIQVDECRVYFASYQGETYLRYTDGAKHITFNSQTEKPERISYTKVLANTLAGRYSRIYVIESEMPLRWDVESASIPDTDQESILDRIRRAVLQRYFRFRIDVLNGPK